MEITDISESFVLSIDFFNHMLSAIELFIV